MPKMKSVKGAVKRFKVKKNGTVKRGTAFRSHILTKQDAGTRREQNSPKTIAKVDEKNIKAMINQFLVNSLISNFKELGKTTKDVAP